MFIMCLISWICLMLNMIGCFVSCSSLKLIILNL